MSVAVPSAAAVATTKGIRSPTVGPGSHCLAASKAAPAAPAHQAQRPTRDRPAGKRVFGTSRSAEMSQSPAGVSARPQRLKEMRPNEVARLIDRQPKLIVPVGSCDQHGPHLPVSCDTIIVERLASDLSAEFG